MQKLVNIIADVFGLADRLGVYLVCLACWPVVVIAWIWIVLFPYMEEL